MNKKFNEEGYALLLVMMLVLLFTTLGMGLLAMNMNASKQFNLKEEQVQARHQAEMGILHYQTMLEKTVQANPSNLSCSKIEPLLSVINNSPAATSTYSLTRSENSNFTCTQKANELEIEVISKSKSNLEKEKIIEATYYINNIGDKDLGGNNHSPVTVLPVKPVTAGPKLTTWNKVCDNNGGKKCKDAHEIIDNFTEVNTITMKQNSLHFKDNLVLQKLIVQGGNGAGLKVNKNMYVSDEIDVQTHACMAIGKNLIVKNSITSKNKLHLIVYWDAYLPKVFESTSNNNEMYVFGDIYLPADFQVPTNSKMDVYVKGNVYQENGINPLKKFENPFFQQMSSNKSKVANGLPCATPGLEKPVTPSDISKTPLWKLEDDPLIKYN